MPSPLYWLHRLKNAVAPAPRADLPAREVYRFVRDPGGRNAEYLGTVEVIFHDTRKISRVVPRIDAFMRECVAEYE